MASSIRPLRSIPILKSSCAAVHLWPNAAGCLRPANGMKASL
jgi:hypothetical protein